jgi:hypothetical protein
MIEEKGDYYISKPFDVVMLSEKLQMIFNTLEEA